jgi:hypothetical protein
VKNAFVRTRVRPFTGCGEIELEAQFGFMLNWAFVSQSGEPLIVEVMNILVQSFWDVLRGFQAEI